MGVLLFNCETQIYTMKILNVLMVSLLFVSGNNNGQEKKDIHSIIGTKYKSDSIVENVLKKNLNRDQPTLLVQDYQKFNLRLKNWKQQP